MFNKVLPQPSELVTVTLPRPLGVVFEYDSQLKRAVVVDTIEGSAAAQKQRVAGLNPRLAKESVKTGTCAAVGHVVLSFVLSAEMAKRVRNAQTAACACPLHRR